MIMFFWAPAWKSLAENGIPKKYWDTSVSATHTWWSPF